MRKKGWRSRPAKSKSRKRFVFLLIVIFTFLSVQTFIFVEKNLREPLMAIAKIRIKQIATEAINTAISDQIAQESDFDKLVDWKTDKTGKITGFMLNYMEHMKITSQTKDVVQHIMDGLGERTEHVPLGEAFNSAILASFGPDVPIRFLPAGAVKVDLNTRRQDAGINMLLVEVYIRVIAEVVIIIPFDTAPEIVSTEIPISYMLVVGDVPMYYYDNKGNPVGSYDTQAPPPTLSLPLQNQTGSEFDDSQGASQMSVIPSDK